MKMNKITYSWNKLKHFTDGYYNQISCPHCHKILKNRDGGWYVRFYGLCMECEVKRLNGNLKPQVINCEYPF